MAFLQTFRPAGALLWSIRVYFFQSWIGVRIMAKNQKPFEKGEASLRNCPNYSNNYNIPENINNPY
jgi:hypothetical protein